MELCERVGCTNINKQGTNISWQQVLRGQHGAHLGLTGPRWAPWTLLSGFLYPCHLPAHLVATYFFDIFSKGTPRIRAISSLQWRHNGRNSVSNHQPHDCLLNRLFRRRSQKTSKLRVTGLCGPVNSPHKWPVTRKMFPFDDVIMCHLHI